MPIIKRSLTSYMLWHDGVTGLYWDSVAKTFLVKRNGLSVSGDVRYLVARILEIGESHKTKPKDQA